MTDIQILDLIEQYIHANNTIIQDYTQKIEELYNSEYNEYTAENLQTYRNLRGDFKQRMSVLEMLYEEICENIDRELTEQDSF